MKTATGLAIVAVGAILAFAVTGHPGWLNVQAAGWVLILVGLAGMFVPRRGYGWLQRRVVRRPPRRRGGRRVVASHVMDSNVVASNGTALPPGAVVLTPEQAEAVKAGALLETEPEVFPGRQLSKAEVEEQVTPASPLSSTPQRRSRNTWRSSGRAGVPRAWAQHRADGGAPGPSRPLSPVTGPPGQCVASLVRRFGHAQDQHGHVVPQLVAAELHHQ